MARLALEDLLKAVTGLLDTIDCFADVDRQPDRPALVGDRAGDRAELNGIWLGAGFVGGQEGSGLILKDAAQQVFPGLKEGGQLDQLPEGV